VQCCHRLCGALGGETAYALPCFVPTPLVSAVSQILHKRVEIIEFRRRLLGRGHGFTSSLFCGGVAAGFAARMFPSRK
jgi:hypothetical protein